MLTAAISPTCFCLLRYTFLFFFVVYVQIANLCCRFFFLQKMFWLFSTRWPARFCSATKRNEREISRVEFKFEKNYWNVLEKNVLTNCWKFRRVKALCTRDDVPSVIVLLHIRCHSTENQKKKEKGRKKQQNKTKKKSNFTRFILIDWSLRFTGVYSRCQQRDELTGPRGRDSFWRQHFPPFLFFFNYLCAKRNNEDDVWRTRVNIRVQPEMERVGWASPKWIFFSFLF